MYSTKIFSTPKFFLSTPPTTVLSLFPTVPSIHHVSDASFVLYHHRAFGSPVLSTFLKAIRAGYLASIPRLTATIVLRNPPLSLATSFGFGHLDACRKPQGPPLYPVVIGSGTGLVAVVVVVVLVVVVVVLVAGSTSSGSGSDAGLGKGKGVDTIISISIQ